MSTSKNSNSSALQKPNDQKSTAPPLVRVKIQKLFHGGDSKLRAVASVTVSGAFAVHGLKVMDGEKGLFVSMPNSSYKSGGETKYQDIFHPVTAESRQTLIDAVLKAYEQALTEQQDGSETQSGDEESQEDEEPDMAQSM
ncbi:MAG: SpoVG family protein [Eubacteriales bacterium]|nr:SpoVG family protein [Eubacteriales bacterium]